MRDHYEAFCLTDRWFYDTPSRGDASAHRFAAAEAAPPPGWRREADDQWVMLSPTTAEDELPTQGWKVHLSGCIENAERIIDVAWSYCVTRGLAFKFLGGPRVVLARNAKYAGRSGSGKLVTIYPGDEAELESVCRDLADALAGEPGPYILSDLRWGPGPVHVRYGGFRPRYCLDDRGQTVSAIEDPSGNLVPDVRGPVFSVPPWVTLPACLAPHDEARRAVTVAELPYEVVEALHFSNGGGVYRALDRRTGATVVLKEARPHAGLSGDGADAVTRLRREATMLRRLDDVAAVPRLLDEFAVGEHEFLAVEHMEGEALNRAVVQRSPLLTRIAAAEARARYADWARSVHDAVADALDQVHRAGVVYCDLHMTNVLVRPDDTVALVDFEVAQDVSEDRRPGLGAVGFTAPAGSRGLDLDRHALACLKLALFLPLEALLGLDRGKAVELADVVAELFPVPRSWLDDAVAVICDQPEPDVSPRWQPRSRSVRPAGSIGRSPAGPGSPDEPVGEPQDALVTAILASATPERDDRLFPGDIAQFDPGGGLCLAHGAAGVLHALDVAGADRFEDGEDWLRRHAKEPEDGTKLGLYDGMHGVAWVLARLGHLDEAQRALQMCLDEPWQRLGDDLYGGLPGVGLSLLALGDILGETELAAHGQRAAQIVADRLGAVDDVPTTSAGRNPVAGLMHGGAGKALLFCDLHQRTGEPALLDHAAVALRQDLRRCTRTDDGELHVDEGWRTMPYLARGSVGIAVALLRYLALRPDDELADALAATRDVACAVLYAQTSLFTGRAGMVLHLADLSRTDPDDERVHRDLDAQVRRLGWHALRYGGGLAFPGEQLLRLSMDLATGTAGVLLALAAAAGDQPVHLPLVRPTSADGSLEQRERR